MVAINSASAKIGALTRNGSELSALHAARQVVSPVLESKTSLGTSMKYWANMVL